MKKRLAQRTRKRDETIEQQAATAEVLKALSRSRFDLQIVLDPLFESAMRLCASDAATTRRHDGNVLKVATTFADQAAIAIEADQAAIAIENVRLFEAEQPRSRELGES